MACIDSSLWVKICGLTVPDQAVAIARQNVPTHMVGRVGADDFGHQLRHVLAVDGVNVDAVQVDAEVRTGIAAIGRGKEAL